MAHELDFLVLPRTAREQRVNALLDGADRGLAARALGVTLGLSSEKAALAEGILEKDPRSPDLLPLVRHLPARRLRDLATAIADESAGGDLLLEIARHCPEAVRPFVERIDDPSILAAARADAPDGWVAELRKQYEATHDLGCVRAIGQVRTDRARSALIDLSKKAPDDHLRTFALALENGGVFPKSRAPSIYFDAFRGYVASHVESPHRMGAGLGAAVPLCPFCRTPAERLLTLDAGALADFELPVSPSFFWYRCACDNGDHILVKHTNAGLAGVMTAMTEGPETDAGPRASLVLEKVPRASVVGGPARPGAGEHQVGGYPVWIEERFFPRVPGTDRGAMFLASIDLETVPLGQKVGWRGIVYCFFDDESRIAVSLREAP